MSNTSNDAETAATLALLARMSLALGLDAGITPDGKLCIGLKAGRHMTWNLNEQDRAQFDGLPPFSSRSLPVDEDQRVDCLDQAFALPSGWLPTCAEHIKMRGFQGGPELMVWAATDAWRQRPQDGAAPEIAAADWVQDSERRSQWVSDYVHVSMAAAEQASTSEPDLDAGLDAEDHANMALLTAETPLYKVFSPDQVYAELDARSGHDADCTPPDLRPGETKA